jgi:hypothetical protein
LKKKTVVTASPEKNKRNKFHTESMQSDGDSQLVKAINYKLRNTSTPYTGLKSPAEEDQKVVINISNLEINNINNNSLLVSAREGRLYNETKNDNSITLEIEGKDTNNLLSEERKNSIGYLKYLLMRYKLVLIVGIAITLILLIIILKVLN